MFQDDHATMPLVGKQATPASSPYANWRAKSAAARDNLGMSQHSEPWAGNSTGRAAAATERVRNLLNVNWVRARRQHPAVPKEELMKDLMVDWSQCILRAMPLYKEWPTLTTSTTLYHYGEDSVVPSKAHMQVLGWPLARLAPCFSEHDIRDLAGDGISLPLATVLSAAFFLNPYSEWWQ